MKQGKVIGKIFGAALVLVLVGAVIGGLLAMALTLSILDRNQLSAQEGVSYIIVYTLNPEGIEIARIEDMNQCSVTIYDGES